MDFSTASLAPDPLPGASEIASRMHARYEGVTDLMTSAGVFMVGQVARLCGRTEDAVRLLMEGRRLGSAVPGLEFLIAAELSHAAALTGNRELAGRSHAEAAAARRRGLAVFELWGDLATTRVTLLDGGVRAAVEQALDCAARARACRAVGYELIALHDVVRLGAAPAVADRLGDIAADLPESPARWYARHAVAAARHDGPALHQVAGAFARAGANLLAAEATTQASAAYSRAGRRPGVARVRPAGRPPGAAVWAGPHPRRSACWRSPR
ncbi:hypothetical protein [Nonomuraea sp. SYSU D8015]|uniref:hypothetical protein n=1 Tax=Nonomuraea sp. SYSU D8015 TaxID=2593644 RepID=UPI0016606379|nr:hypothetical protein [Nonomuraea sp. SYSU D8015]